MHTPLMPEYLVYLNHTVHLLINVAYLLHTQYKTAVEILRDQPHFLESLTSNSLRKYINYHTELPDPEI